MTRETDVLKDVMLSYAPALADDYADLVRRTFAGMQADLGPGLRNVYNSFRWARIFQGLTRSNVSKPPSATGRTYPLSEYHLLPYNIVEDRLAENARRYGERVSLEWYVKMSSKLGNLQDVTVSTPGRGGDIVINGSLGDRPVRVEQHSIINFSSRGTPFHQFPARIYVSGRFVSEAGYKRLAAGGLLTPRLGRSPRKRSVGGGTIIGGIGR